MKFRLISEEATSEKPFIWKKAVTRLLSQPLSWAYLSPILLKLLVIHKQEILCIMFYC